jgi:hypothetical protein
MARLRVWLTFALLSAIWGSSHLFIRVGDEQLTSPALVALRLFILALGLGTITALRRGAVSGAGARSLRGQPLWVVSTSIVARRPFLHRKLR